MIYATVRERDLAVRSSSPVTSGSVGIKMEVSVDSHWDGLYKYVVFQSIDTKITVQYFNDPIIVPYEVLTAYGHQLKIGIYGTNDVGDIVIPTIWNGELIVYEGVSLSNDPGAEPTPTVVAKMNRDIAEAMSTANDAMALSEDTESTVTSAMNWLYEHGMPSGDVPLVRTFNGRNGTVNLTSEDVAAVLTKQMLLNYMYPVGSYYMSSEPTSPASLFGGTWEQVKDRFILAAGDTYTAGDTGGEAAHTLTVDEMPSHSHTINPVLYVVVDRFGSGSRDAAGDYSGYGSQYWLSNTGGDTAHNNMPPFLVAYIWHRIA